VRNFSTPDTAFAHCCYPTSKQQSNLLNKQNRQSTFTVTLRGVRVTIVAVKKARKIIHSECVFVASGIQREMRMRRIVISGLSGSTTFFYIIL
jgi:hypothetical protein